MTSESDSHEHKRLYNSRKSDHYKNMAKNMKAYLQFYLTFEVFFFLAALFPSFHNHKKTLFIEKHHLVINKWSLNISINY